MTQKSDNIFDHQKNRKFVWLLIFFTYTNNLKFFQTYGNSSVTSGFKFWTAYLKFKFQTNCYFFTLNILFFELNYTIIIGIHAHEYFSNAMIKLCFQI